MKQQAANIQQRLNILHRNLAKPAGTPTMRTGTAVKVANFAAATSQYGPANVPPITAFAKLDTGVDVFWGETKSHFNFVWLYDNCSSMFTSSNQKVYREMSKIQNIKPTNVSLQSQIANNSNVNTALHVSWPEVASIGAPGAAKTSVYTSQFLHKHRCNLGTMASLNEALDPRKQARSRPLVNIDFNSLFPSEVSNGSTLISLKEQHNELELFKFLKAINDFGVCLVKNVPAKEKTVLRVSRLLGEPSRKIYGEFFDVRSELNPINVAYTTEKLEFHMDLAYFESPPGIQFLHAFEFDQKIKGGMSVFIDGHAIAEELKHRNPKHFEVLKMIPATFMKHHVERADPLIMYYQRPHIVTNHFNQVISVFWSPPFEGPLMFPRENDANLKFTVQDYYEAYGAFQALMNSDEMLQKYGYKFRMLEGEMVVFNNRRMLHARTSFANVEGCVRHLQGCYNDIDTFLNRFRLLSEKFDNFDANPNEEVAIAVKGENRYGISNFR